MNKDTPTQAEEDPACVGVLFFGVSRENIAPARRFPGAHQKM
jgi:hypothetical protein